MSGAKRITFHGLRASETRTITNWEPAKALVFVCIESWDLPRKATELAALFAGCPDGATVSVGAQGEEDAGLVTIDWTEDATPEDIAQRDAERTAEAQEAADRAEFEAWRASREATR